MENKNWTAEDVKKILTNPVYAGMGPFPQIVSDELWIKAFIKAMNELGVTVALQLMLNNLRESLQTGGK